MHCTGVNLHFTNSHYNDMAVKSIMRMPIVFLATEKFIYMTMMRQWPGKAIKLFPRVTLVKSKRRDSEFSFEMISLLKIISDSGILATFTCSVVVRKL